MGIQDTPAPAGSSIGLFGKRNVGKSSLINALTGQEISLVSPVPGTTTDPVSKSFELHGVGPVVFWDTAGLDDTGPLGRLRVEATRQAVEKTDLALLVLTELPQEELTWLSLFREKGIPVLVVLNQCDRLAESSLLFGRHPAADGRPSCSVCQCQKRGKGIPQLRQAIQEAVPDDFWDLTITGDLANEGDVVLLVMPQDLQAPKRAADSAPGADDPGTPGQKMLRDELYGRLLASHPDSPQNAASPDYYRFPGFSHGVGLKAAREPSDLLFHPICRV